MHSIIKSVLDHYQYYLFKFHPLGYAIDSRVKKQWVINRSMVSNTLKYCYFRIPKCANSTIVRTLAYYDPSIPYDGKDETGESYKKKATLLHARALSVSALYKKYYLFTFTRNPYLRALSAYLDKIIPADKKGFVDKRNAIAALSASGSELTFRAFVRYLETGGLCSDPHWAPQCLMLPVGREMIHYVGKVEKLDDDLELLINHLFGTGAYQGAIMRRVGRTGSADKVLQYYDSELFDRVYKLYEQDFIRFHYPKDWSI